ncbi:MAG: GNAT family N-acetyltransferase [Dehalococcoidia bacterium]|nr:GNAT family N-acetyltransferase [Dehalococcoidia bacterium]
MDPVSLSTARLVLRPWRPADVDAAYEYARDPEFSRYLPAFPAVVTLEDERRFIEAQLATNWSTHPSWAVTLADVPIGGVNLRIDHLRDVAEVGYGIARSHWGRGYATEAARAAMDWVFTRYPLRRFVATADARNAASLRVMEHLGLERETVLRGLREIRGERVDSVVCAVTRQRWQARRTPQA